jgi:predicted porin
MRLLKPLLLASAAGLLAVSAAQAADLPTKKAPPAAAAPNCYASFWSWLDSTAADCPLSLDGVTVYGTIDVGGGYESAASRFNEDYNNGVSELIAKTSGNARWQLVPNGLSQSNIGVKIKEQVAPNWYVIGDVNTGFDPYSMRLADGPQSLVDNNGISAGPGQTANADSSRAGQWDNTRAYLGLSNSTFGTLTAGRQYSFGNDLANNYDPTGGSYAFSLIGTSATPVGGLGDTELARYNTSVKYLLQYNIFRAGAEYEFGNYSWGNPANGAYQFDLGGDYAGFSVDAIYSHANDAVFLSSLSAAALSETPGYADDLGATIADVDSFALAGKYKTGPFQVFAGYAYDRLTNPTDSYAADEAASGFDSIADIDVPGGKVCTTYSGGACSKYGSNISITAYTIPKVLQTGWVGAKYAVLSNLDVAGGYYVEWQNNYSGGSCSGIVSGSSAESSHCNGNLQAVSGLIDWRPVKRVDLYTGVLYSEVHDGMAVGYTHTNNTAWTSGVRVSF